MQIAIPSILIKVALGVGALFLTKKLASVYLQRRKAKKVRAYPKNVVILHQFPRGKFTPSASPFALKLETWLRMADVKYQVKEKLEFS
jgi:hypothetical protein